MAEVKLSILLAAIDKATPAIASVQDALKAGGDAAADFQAKWGHALAVAQSAGVGMMAAGTAIVGSLVMAGKAAGEFGGKVFDATRRTGMAAEELTALKYAAEQSGVGFEDLVPSLNKLQRSISDAASGSKPMQKAFADLGVSVTDAAGKVRPTQEILQDVATAIAAIPDEAVRADTAMTLFGRGGAAMLPMLMESGEGIRKLTDQAHKLGLTMSDETAAAMDEAGDKMDAAKEVMLSAWRMIGAQVAPVIASIAMSVAELVAKVKGFAAEHPALSKAITLVFGAGGVLILGIGAGVVAFAGLITKIQAAQAAMLAFGETGTGMKLAGGLLKATGYLKDLPGLLKLAGTSAITFLGGGATAAEGLGAALIAAGAGAAALAATLAAAFWSVQRTYKMFLEMRIAQEEAKQAEQDYEDMKRGAQGQDRYVMNKREWALKQGYSGVIAQAAENVAMGKTRLEDYGPKAQQKIKAINEGYDRYYRDEMARISARESTKRRLEALKQKVDAAEAAGAKASADEAAQGATAPTPAAPAATLPEQASSGARPGLAGWFDALQQARETSWNRSWGQPLFGGTAPGTQTPAGVPGASPGGMVPGPGGIMVNPSLVGTGATAGQVPARVVIEHRLSNDGETSRILLSNPAARDQICRTIADVARMLSPQFG